MPLFIIEHMLYNIFVALQVIQQKKLDLLKVLLYSVD